MKTDRISGLERLFSRPELLRTALTHRSVSAVENNERLEFLGDAVIELAVRWSLSEEYGDASEGELTRMKIGLVRKATLARCADRLGLRDSILTGADFGDGYVSDAVAADAYEAVAGALFVDSGFNSAFSFVNSSLLEHEHPSRTADPKTLLQEYCQSRGIALPEYRTDLTTGPPHEPFFLISVSVENSVQGTGRASSKKKAQEMAAAEALRILEGKD